MISQRNIDDTQKEIDWANRAHSLAASAGDSAHARYWALERDRLTALKAQLEEELRQQEEERRKESE